MFHKMTRCVLAACLGLSIALVLLGTGPVQAGILVTEGFDGYSLGTHTSAAPPPNPGDFPTLNGPTGWGTPFRSHIGANLQIVISAGPSGPLFDGASTTQYPTSQWRDRIMASPIHSNSDGTVTWQAMKVSTAGSGAGSFRVNNSNGGMDYRVALDGSNQYELLGGHIDTVSSASGIAASTAINRPDFLLTKIENIAGGQSVASTWINPNLAGGEAGLGSADATVTYAPFAGNRNIGEIVLQPGPNIRLDNIVFGETFADALPDYTWADPTAGGTWENDANWAGPPGIPNAPADRAIFPQPSGTSNVAYPATVTVSGPKILRSLILDGPNGVNQERSSYTITGDPLTLAGGGEITHAAFHTWGVVHQEIQNDIVMEGDLDINMNWDSANVSNFTLRGTITGSGTLTLDNTHSPTGGAATGRLHLRGNSSSTFTGEVVINGGSVMLYTGSLGDTAAGTTINSGSVMGSTAEPFTINGPAAFQSYGGNRVYSGDVLVNPGATLTLYPGGNQLTASGDISGDGAVRAGVRGPGGRITISGNNTFAGPLDIYNGGIDDGTVVLSGSLAHSNISVEAGVIFEGAPGGLIAFSDGDAIDVDGTMDAENMQFDLLALTGDPATLVDYTDGAFGIGSLPNLDDLLTADSAAAGWLLTDTGTLITAGFAVVPEPSTLVLAGLGFLGLLGFARWRRRRRA